MESLFIFRLPGSIPAWAGEPWRAAAECRPAQVYPRVGGGTSEAQRSAVVAEGLSPRGRGNRHVSAATFLGARSIPAWAGEPTILDIQEDIYRVYPRVGGGTSWSQGLDIA